MNLPNLLSIIRIILAPVFALVFFIGTGSAYEQTLLIVAALVLILSGLTDFFDGVIARSYNMITELGKFLDPFADKLTQAIVCVCITIKHIEFLLVLIPFFIKELMSLAASVVFIKEKMVLPSSRWYGKATTFIFYILTIVIIVVPDLPSAVIYVFSGIIVFFLILTIINYLPIYFRIRKQFAKKGTDPLK